MEAANDAASIDAEDDDDDDGVDDANCEPREVETVLKEEYIWGCEHNATGATAKAFLKLAP